jgi:Fumarylacetoacetate (FAA) hydrolase family
MRLVTYDRRGHRRLGAILDGRVVDLPDAVGHPAFPATLEAFVQSSRGTVLDAARAALAREDVMNHVVKGARILPPLFPRSLLIPSAPGSLAGLEGAHIERRIAGPEQEIPWPVDAAWLDYEPKVAAVLGLEMTDVETDGVQDHVFGYTLVSDWVAKDASGDPLGTSEGVPLAIGPCVVTTDECEPQTMFLQAKVEGQEMAKGNLNGAARSLFALIAAASRGATLERADAFALGPFPARDDDPGRRLWPGATVELAAEGIGTLRNRLGPRPPAG